MLFNNPHEMAKKVFPVARALADGMIFTRVTLK